MFMEKFGLLIQRLLVATVLLTAIVSLLNSFALLDASGRVDAANLSETVIPVAGTYYGRTELRTGQKMSIDEVVKELIDSGYSRIENPGPRFAPGSFAVLSGTKLRFRSDFPDTPPDITIEWKDRIVSKIVGPDATAVDRVMLPGKPLETFDFQLASNATRVAGHQVVRQPVRNGDLDGSIIQDMFAANEGRSDLPFSPFGTANAIRLSAESDSRGGGSPPLMQLAKLYTGDHRKIVSRKIFDLYFASDLGRRLTPSDAFETYANLVFFGTSKRGRNILGIETAATELFGKPAKSLGLSESSFLTTLAPRPDRLQKLWSADRNAEIWARVKKLQVEKLDNLLKKFPDRYNAADIEAAKKKPIVFVWERQKIVPSQTSRMNALVAPMIEDEFKAFRLSQPVDDLDIPFVQLRSLVGQTRIDATIQRGVHKTLRNYLPAIQKMFRPIGPDGKPAPDSMIGVVGISDNETGNVLALTSFATDPNVSLGGLYLNYGVVPCSQKKPFDYACALEDGKVTLASRFVPQNCRLNLPDGTVWQPNIGVGDSEKLVAVGLPTSDDGMVTCIVSAVGLDRSAQFYGQATGNFATPMNSRWSNSLPPIVTIGFGGGIETSVLEFLSAYSAFARRGAKHDIHALAGVYQAGKLIWTPTSEDATLFSAETAYLTFTAMRASLGVGPFGQYGNLRGLKFSKYLQEHEDVHFACKTGSGPHSIGISCVGPKFTLTFQAFYANHSRFRQTGDVNIYAASAIGPAWSEIMFQILNAKPDLFEGQIYRPDTIVNAEIDPVAGCRRPGGVMMPFKAGTEPEDCASADPDIMTNGGDYVVDTQNDEGVNIRESNEIKSPIVGFVEEGESLTVDSCDDEQVIVNGRAGRWCRVRYRETSGWAWGWSLRKISEP
jgi:membrane peptidoglycan carboxypeptidase